MPFKHFDMLVFGVAGCALLVAFSHIVYAVLYYWTYSYSIEADQLAITKGVILRRRSYYPLDHIIEFSTGQGILDLLLGVQYLEITTRAFQAARIEGLRRRSAQGLRDHLVAYRLPAGIPLPDSAGIEPAHAVPIRFHRPRRSAAVYNAPSGREVRSAVR